MMLKKKGIQDLVGKGGRSKAREPSIKRWSALSYFSEHLMGDFTWSYHCILSLRSSSNMYLFYVPGRYNAQIH